MKLSLEEQALFPYIWLFASPLLTVPTLFFLSVFADIFFEDQYDVQAVLIVLGSATWHLVLLIPALFGKSEFVRWHGHQALLIAGIRTIVATLSFVFALWLCWFFSSWESGSVVFGN